MPDATVGDVAKELGKRWNEASSDTRAKYEALAAKDKARYSKVYLIFFFLFFNEYSLLLHILPYLF